MNSVKKQLISGSMAIASLLCAESLLANTFANAVTPLKTPVFLSQGLRSDPTPWSRSYDCGQAQVTLTEQGKGRYVYEAVNMKGNTITIKNGIRREDDNNSSIYSFHKNDADFVVEDRGNGTAVLTTANPPDSNATYDCKY